VALVVAQEMPVWLRDFFDLAAVNPWLDLVVLPVAGQPAPARSSIPADLRALLWYERRYAIAGRLAPVGVHDHDAIELAEGIAAGAELPALCMAVAALRPDLILLLGGGRWADAMGSCAAHGCWQLDPTLSDAGCATQALLAPVMRGEVATAVTLELQYPDRAPTVLVTSGGSTCRASAVAQRERAFRKMPALLMRALRPLADRDTSLPETRNARLRLAVAGPAGFGAGLRTLARTLAFRAAARWRRRSQPCETAWHLLVRQGPPPIDPAAPRIGRPALLSAPGECFWADPCVIEDAGRRLIFVEQWEGDDGKGIIACLEVMPDNRVKRLGNVLEHATHLSYPQPFQWEGQWYLTVESGHERCASLYRAAAFPMQWEPVCNLIEGWNCVDPTLYHHGEHWYLFANVAESGGSTWDELFLFVADGPAGPFRPHPANPIVSDARRARPAGRLFQRDGRLIRPAQDCAPCYGSAVVFNDVLELSPTRYHERPLGRLDNHGELGMDGCHTYSQIEGVEVLDARGTPSQDLPAMTVVECEAAPLTDKTRLPGGRNPLAGWGGTGVLSGQALNAGCHVDATQPRPG